MHRQGPEDCEGNTIELGDNPGEVPPPDLVLEGVSVAISSSGAGFCALRDTGIVRCWDGEDDGLVGADRDVGNAGLRVGT